MIVAGAVVAARVLDSLAGPPVSVPDRHQLVHLQFRRFAGCPFCTLHLANIERRHGELVAAGIREVVVFHSTAAALRKHQGQAYRFDIIPDPHKHLYREFGVERSLRGLLDLRVLGAEVRGLRAKLRHRTLGFNMRGGALGLPADFLIDPSGVVVAAKYGTNTYDQWTVDELLALAAEFHHA